MRNKYIFLSVFSCETNIDFLKAVTGTSLMVQWLRLQACNAGGSAGEPSWEPIDP